MMTGWQKARFSLRRALIVTRREVRDQLRDWRIIFPVIVLTLFFPLLMNFTAERAVSFVAEYGATIVGERLIPFLLMVVGFFPISVSLVIALESFVGEKERHSLEPLLTSPLTDSQLYLGKMLAAMTPPLFASYMGIAVYLTGLALTIHWYPDPRLLVQILALTTVQALLMVSGAVVISTQTTSVRAANLLASFIVIPVSLLIQAESVIMFWGKYDVLWWVLGGLLLVTFLLVRMGVQLFNREELLGRDIDELNLKAAWKVFAAEFVGQGGSVWWWYRREIGAALRRQAVPVLIMIAALAAAVIIGYCYAPVYQLPVELVEWRGIADRFGDHLSQLGFVSSRGMMWVLGTNLRALALTTLLGMFSFGTVSTVLLMAPLAITGYFAGQMALGGMNPWLFVAVFILPHGVAEIPAAIIEGGAIIRLGASVVSPPPGKTLGDGWLMALADWAKVSLAVVLPLLVVAAALEVFVTPQVVHAVLTTIGG